MHQDQRGLALRAEIPELELQSMRIEEVRCGLGHYRSDLSVHFTPAIRYASINAPSTGLYRGSDTRHESFISISIRNRSRIISEWKTPPMNRTSTLSSNNCRPTAAAIVARA